MVSSQVRAIAIAINPNEKVEDGVLDSVDTVSNAVVSLASLVLLVVVRLIISGRVAVGGFARN
jgi:hypothetical protein